MINVFQESFHHRLKSWHDLREQMPKMSIAEKCVAVDLWWQKAPLVSHYLHTHDLSSWPKDPWQLLSENTYCEVARGLGMFYTLNMAGISNLQMVEASDVQGNDIVLVLADNAKYILNYWPNTVLNNKLHDFSIRREIQVTA